MAKKRLHWKVHTARLFKEILECVPGASIFKIPLLEMTNILVKIGERAEKLDDPELLLLCCRLTLYDISDPYSKEYNPKVFEILEKRIKSINKK